MSAAATVSSRRVRLGNPTVWFAVITGAGLLVSIVLGFHAALTKAPLVVSSANVRRHGLEATVTVTVTNRTSGQPYCPTIYLSALDRDGLDLQRVTGNPLFGRGVIQPGGTASYRGVFDHLTAKDYRENLDHFEGYVQDRRPCDG